MGDIPPFISAGVRNNGGRAGTGIPNLDLQRFQAIGPAATPSDRPFRPDGAVIPAFCGEKTAT
ncbi:hypothetical protein GCM10027396_18650 [Insolitispirillum peregrinum]